MENIGAKLKKKRLEKGFTLEDVQKKTKIHLNILKAIEEDSLVNLSPIYIKGFLKIYCKLLGVDPDDYISGIKAKEIVKAAEPKPLPEKENKPAAALDKQEPVIPGVIKFIQSKIKLISFIIIVIVVSISLFNLGKNIVLKIKSLPKKQKEEKARVKKTQLPLPVNTSKHATKVNPVKVQKPQIEQATVVNPMRLEATPALIKLGIRAKEDCWMQVKTDGKVIFQNNLKKGRFENWQAKEKIELSLGNAGVVELEVNGKFIPSIGRRGQSIKNILITKDGLSTPR